MACDAPCFAGWVMRPLHLLSPSGTWVGAGGATGSATAWVSSLLREGALHVGVPRHLSPKMLAADCMVS